MEQTLRSIVAALLIFVAGAASLASPALDGGPPTALERSLAHVRAISMAAAGMLWLSLGIRHVRRVGATAKTLAMPLAGLLVLGAVGVLPFYALRFFHSAEEMILSDDRVRARADAVIAAPDSTPEQRAMASRIRAQLVFSVNGEIVPVLDESGIESPFQPTAEDHERRQSQRELRALVPAGIEKVHRSFQQLGVATLAAILLGFWTLVQRAPAVTAHEEG